MQIILGVIFIIVVAFFISRSQSLEKKEKITILAIISTIVIAAILYEFIFSQKQKNSRDLANSFVQGKTLICKDVDVNNTNYSLERGTGSFMPKDTKKTLGTIYAIEDCSIKK